MTVGDVSPTTQKDEQERQRRQWEQELWVMVGKDEPLKQDLPPQNYSNISNNSPYFFGL